MPAATHHWLAQQRVHHGLPAARLIVPFSACLADTFGKKSSYGKRSFGATWSFPLTAA